MAWGVILAVIVSILFSLYILPRKFSKQKPTLYMVYVGLAFFVSAALWYFLAWCFNLRGIRDGQDSLLSVWHLLSCLLGILWGVGGIFFNMAIDKCGLSRSNPWKNLQGPIASFLMLFILQEVTGWEKILFVVAGTLAIFLSAVCFSIKSNNESPVEKHNLKLGILFALMGAGLFGTNSFVAQVITKQGFLFSQNFYFALSVLITTFCIYLIKSAVSVRKKAKDAQRINRNTNTVPALTFRLHLKELFTPSKQTLLPLAAGFLYAVAATLSVLARSLIPGSVSFSIIQLNGFWTALIGIFLFKEIQFKKHWLRICAGFTLSAGAIALLVFAL